VRRPLITVAVALAAVTLVFAIRSGTFAGGSQSAAEPGSGTVAFPFAPSPNARSAGASVTAGPIGPRPAARPGPVTPAPAMPRARPATVRPRLAPLPALRAPIAPPVPPQQFCYFEPPPDPGHAFYFTRGIYTSYRGWGRRGGGSWSVDWPKSDCQFNIVLQRLTNIDSYLEPNAVALDDPALLRFPYVYILEVGRIALSPGEISNLRDFLLKGGFLFVDDFWGDNEWYPFEDAMRQVLPEYPIEPLPLEHEYFHAFYSVDEVLQVPNRGNARYGVTSECGGCYPEVYGIFDDERRLMVVINWNTDLGDAWEWAEQPDYPVKYSTYAFEVGVNAIIYAMSH
jgi:hypothetical protein